MNNNNGIYNLYITKYSSHKMSTTRNAFKSMFSRQKLNLADYVLEIQNTLDAKKPGSAFI